MRRLPPLLPLVMAVLALPAAAQSAAAPDVFVLPEKGHCVACHQVAEGAGPRTRADLGPKLDGSRMRTLGRTRIREIIQDPTRANPATVMPPYERHRILDDGEIQQLVEYLHALP